MDSMTQMFCGESSSIMQEMRDTLAMAREKAIYDQEVVQSIFRGVHTLKADSAMMLFEDMSSLSKDLESALYCFRGEGKYVEDVESFRSVMAAYLDFFEGEVAKLLEGKKPDGDTERLRLRINEYTAEAKRQMDVRGNVQEAPQKRRRRQVYYISPDAEETPVKTSTIHYESDVKMDFGPVAKKMEIVVTEMSQRLSKPVKLLVTGEDTQVKRDTRTKISSALIHMVRNAVDHGIEDAAERESCGKAPMALVRLSFGQQDKELVVSVEDDGAGINREQVLESAKREGRLTKPEEEYTQDEVYQLILQSGVTTTQEVNEYSGRGVGMDVINHNVQEMGGRLEINSQCGQGTKITMYVPA